MVINAIIDLDNGELLEATGKHRISALDIQGSETAELKFTFYKNGSAVTDNSVVSGAVIDFGVKADANYTGTSYLIYHDTFSASSDGLEYSGTPTWATAEVETALGNESSVKLHGQVKVVISGITYYSQVFEVEIHNNVIQAAGTTNSVIFPRLIQSASDPTVNDDSLDGYGVSSLWLNTSTNAVHVLMDNTAGAAVWAGFLGLTNGQLANNLVFNDGIKAVFGTDSDGIELYHQSNHSYLADTGTGALKILGSQIEINNAANTENIATFTQDGGAALFFNNSKKLESTNLGCTISGKLIVNGDLDCSGTTTTFNSTVVTVDDPVFTVGGDTAPDASDNKDRGIEFRYFRSGESAKVGFFGYSNADDAFKLLTSATNNSEVFSGTLADLNVANVQLENSGKIKTWSNDNNYLKFNEWKTQSSSQKIENVAGDIELKASDSDGTIQFETNGTEAARFDSSGKFIAKSIELDSNGADSPTLKVAYDANNYLEFAHNRINGVSSGSHHIAFQTGGTQRARLDSTGLGIGGTPSEKLTIDSGNIQLTNGNYIIFDGPTPKQTKMRSYYDGETHLAMTVANSSVLDLTSSSINVPDNVQLNIGSGIDLIHNSTNGFLKNNVGDLYIENTANDKDIIFKSDDGSGGTETYFYLDGNASSPGVLYTQFPDDSRLTFGDSKDFQIYHSSNATTLRNSGTGHVYLRNDSDGHDFIFQASKDNGDLEEVLRLDGSASSINVPDNVPIKIGTNGDTRIYSTNTLSIYDFYNYDGLFRSLTNDKDIIFQTTTGDAQNEIMRLEGSTTNVGIGGVGSPTAFLHVSKDNDNSGNQFCVADTEGTSAAVRTYTHDGDAQGLIINHYYAEGGSGNEYARYADFVSNVGNGAATKMRFITKNAANTYSTTIIDNEGRLGIGGTPSAKLDISTDDEIVAIFSSTDNKSIIQLSDNDTNGYLSAENSRFSLGFYQGAHVNNLNFYNNNLGIGTTSPSELLHIEGSNASINVRESGASTVKMRAGSIGRIGTYSDNDFSIVSNSTDQIRIKSNGNVGIGTSSPSSNADLTLGNGELCMAETTTPTADANFGKIYCKSDNKLYFQDGAGTEHEIAFA